MNNNKQHFREIYNSLPQKLREIIVSEEFVGEIEKISKENQLSDTQKEELFNFTRNFLMRIAKKNDFSLIGKEWKIPETTILKIQQQLENKIFNDLDNLYRRILNNIKIEEEKNGREFDVDYYIESQKYEEENKKTTREPAKTEKTPIEKKQFSIEVKSTIIQWGTKISVSTLAFDKIKKGEIVKKVRGALEVGDRNSTHEFVKSLPFSIQELVFDKAWSERTREIGKKYSLDPTQTDILLNNVLFVLLGLDKPEDFLKLMTSELGISRLLADQIIEDLEMRVFEYALKTLENTERKNPVPVTPKVAEAPVVKSIPVPVVAEKPKVPEIKPVNLPMVEKGEVAHDVKIPVAATKPQDYKPSFAEKEKTISETPASSHINYNKSSETPEPIQRPVGVPRFTGVKLEEDTMDDKKVTPPSPQTPNQAIIKENPPKPEVKPQSPEVKNYAVDPYREPLE